jgi:hypothetical protein
MKIAVVGAGWYGCHIALALKKIGHEITLFERNEDIFCQISGKFGVRLHAGPHYPRSKETRRSCQRGLEDFNQSYPELIVRHSHSVYGLGDIDANGEPSKVGKDIFLAVGQECKAYKEIVPEEFGYRNLITAFDIDEPTIAVGKRLRETFRNYLNEANIKIFFNYDARIINNRSDKVIISDGQSTDFFDYVVNATSYQDLLQDIPPPFEVEVVYQPCLALTYEDKNITLPFSFIVMDGWFPCLMPYNDQFEKDIRHRHYILTHGKWTIMGSFQNAEDAKDLLANLSEDFIHKEIKSNCEQQIMRFMPDFKNRFNYLGWKGEVLAKIKTNKEFRSAVTYETHRVIHIIPGKVSNIFDASSEVISLVENKNTVTEGNYKYVKGGVLYESFNEITEKPVPGSRNTCTLQTFEELTKKTSNQIFQQIDTN